MHPNAYLQTYWRCDIRPEVFVAMSFAEVYQSRFNDIIEPAINSVTYRERRLKANRVDLSKTGDSILTDIVDGIVHSEMVLADVSIAGYDAKSGRAYRNGNVMYEVGVALACRQSSEVLLIRDDQDRFLFDVSTIPHKHIDFSDAQRARKTLAEAIVGRLNERDHLHDARVLTAIAGLTAQERQILSVFAPYRLDQAFHVQQTNLATLAALPRLLDKQLLVAIAMTADSQAIFKWTRLGYTIAQNLDRLLPVVQKATHEEGAEQSHAPEPAAGPVSNGESSPSAR